jgi:hypothetical protein
MTDGMFRDHARAVQQDAYDAGLRMMDNDELITEWSRLEDAIAPLRETILRIEYLIQLHMESDGGTEFPSKHGTATLTPSRVTYDGNRLDQLYEHIDESELSSSGAVIPAHEVTVERRWNATKVKTFAKRSAAVRAIIEGARVEGRAKLRIKRTQR